MTTAMTNRLLVGMALLVGLLVAVLPVPAHGHDCNPNPCDNGGLCRSVGMNLYECDCAPGWIGSNCQEEDPDYTPPPTPVPTESPTPSPSPSPSPTPSPSPIPTPSPNPCDPSPCLNGGICSVGTTLTPNGYGQCSCPAGWKGLRCSIPQDATRCSPSDHQAYCYNDAECFYDPANVPQYFDPICACAFGWEGQSCESAVEPSPTPDPTASPMPTEAPAPTLEPTATPTLVPTVTPTPAPTLNLTPAPSATPMLTPVSSPPSPSPSPAPTALPTDPGTRDDFDGDGVTDPAVYDPTTGFWSVRGSTIGLVTAQFGGVGWRAVPGDYDGDGVTEAGLFAPGPKTWTSALIEATHLAVTIPTTPAFDAAVASGDWVPAPGDYDGDGVTDVAVYGPDTGLWVIQRSSDDGLTQATLGGTGYRAVPADFDGDGKLDVAVYQIATGAWSYLSSSQSAMRVDFQFSGGKRFLPVPADYDGDGRADPATYQKKKGKWRILPSTTGVPYTVLGMGGAGQVATPGDFDGDGKVDPAAYRAANGLWRYLASSTGDKVRLPTLGGSSYQPVVGQRPQ